MKWALLAGAVVVAGCGGGGQGGPTRARAMTQASAICQNAAIPGLPRSGRGGSNRAVRMAGLAQAQERREVGRLRAIGWKNGEFDDALDVFDGALAYLDRFAREERAGSAGRAARSRAAYDRAIVEWQARMSALGLDVCSRYGFVF